MSDIHQEWHDLRKKNGDFICHLDGEMAKIEKEKAELKRREQLQGLADAGAFAMQFVAPPPFNCYQDYRDILKALNKAQADRIETLEKELIARKEQRQIDLAVKKDLDEKLDKATADYRALWVERDNLMDTISQMEKTIRDLDERNGNLRERLAQTNASLKRSIQKEFQLQSDAAYLRTIRESQAKEIERLRTIVDTQNGSCSAYTQQGMQSKIAKQAAEIKRLTEENERLSRKNDELSGRHEAQKANIGWVMESGKIKGMEELWTSLQWVQDRIEAGYQLMPVYGYYSMADCVNGLTATSFLRKTKEWQEKEGRDIKLGDEVEIFDEFDHDISDIGIVIAINKDNPCFAVIGQQFKGCFYETDIQSGNVKKTGKHYDAIPFDYLT